MALPDFDIFGPLVDDAAKLGPALDGIEASLTNIASFSWAAVFEAVAAELIATAISASLEEDVKEVDNLASAFELTAQKASLLNLEVGRIAGTTSDAALGFNLVSQSNAIEQKIQDLNRLSEIANTIDVSPDWAAGIFGGRDEDKAAAEEGLRILEKYCLTYDDAQGQLGELTTAQDLYTQVLSMGGPGAEKAREAVAGLMNQLQTGEINVYDFAGQLSYMSKNYDELFNETALNEAMLRQYAETALSAAQKVGLLNDNIELFVAAGIQTPAAVTAFALTQSALESTFNVIVGGTEKLSQSSQAVADWSASLFDSSKGVAPLKQAMDDGAIGAYAYSEALTANTQIQEANAAIQNDILAIQAIQAPLLADLTEKQAEYIDKLAHLPAEQQLVSLGYMDAAESAKAMELAQLAAQAASGELGATGTETATKIIEGAANADPVLRAMLDDMGLISEGANGEVVVNFPNATQLTDNTNALRGSIDALTRALGGIPPSIWTTIYVNDQASYAIDSVGNRLYNLDGNSATVYIKTETGYLPPVYLGQRNGGIIGYANGGMVQAQLAEAGPELLTFRNGGQALVPFPGIYAVDIGTAVLPAPATKSILSNAAAASGSAGMVVNNPIINLYPSSIGIEEQITAELYRWTHQR